MYHPLSGFKDAVSGIMEVRMSQGFVQIFAGDGRGKTGAAIGQGVKAAGAGKSVVIIQFLKGKPAGEFEMIRRLEPEMKLFSFEKSEECFFELSEERKHEEIQNIRNGINFAKKVLATGECDLLILDEILGLLDNQIIGIDDLRAIVDAKPEEAGIIMTGIHIREDVCQMADEVKELKTIVQNS